MIELSPFMLGLHALFAVVWVGGMFFAYQVLRPSVPAIEPPPERLKLWNRVFGRFFYWVWIAVVVIPATGYWQIFIDFGGFTGAGLHIHWMHGTGWLMIVLFIYLYMKPYAAFRTAVAGENWDDARHNLERIRKIVAINLVLGLITVILGSTGRLWA
ncbi:CopD family protein [Thalassospiraceae bacterium LMO-JJ14]|nr:CopD family protein [Thalassospiraceae bacterium LMO-JJ14]